MNKEAIDTAAATAPHICVCACTYKRAGLLTRLLEGLGHQETGGRFSYSVLIVDNDRERSAEAVAAQAREAYQLAIEYCVEPTQNIALARNKAVEQAEGDYIAFIDDDEIPGPLWLRTLFDACAQFGVDGVLGPVKPHFDAEPPRWVVDGKFYDRPSYPTGYVIDGAKGRTGNVLLKKRVFAGLEQPFRPEFRTGEDQDFFRRMIAKGFVFVWCHEALAYEVVPPVRWSRKFVLKRALLRGAIALQHPTFNSLEIAKSLAAVPAYAILSPIALLRGQGPFMVCADKLFNHAGKLLALVGCHPIKQAYVTE